MCFSSKVDHTFEVKGVGSVVSGTAVAGSIAVGQRLLLGPNSDGHFTSVLITGIQRSQVLAACCYLGLSVVKRRLSNLAAWPYDAG